MRKDLAWREHIQFNRALRATLKKYVREDQYLDDDTLTHPRGDPLVFPTAHLIGALAAYLESFEKEALRGRNDTASN
jgi:hypothetical protein